MSEQDRVKAWESEIALAEKYRDARGRVATWKQAREWYENRYPAEVISVNYIYGIGRALVPTVYFKTPTIVVRALQERYQPFVPVLEAIDEWLIGHLGLKQQIKLGILDAFLTNVAIFKFGYHSISTELPPAPKEAESQAAEAVGELLGEAPQAAEGEEDDGRLRHSYHDWVKPDAPWMLRVQPEDFLIPNKCRDEASAPWCAFRFVRPLADIQRDPVYRRPVTAQLSVNTGTTTPDPAGIVSPSTYLQNQEPEEIEGYEIWDKRDGTIRVLVKGQNAFLREEKHGLEIDGLPMEILRFNPVGWDFWGPSDVDQIHAQQIELNETRTLEIMHKRAAVLKLLVDQNGMDDAEIAKLTKGTLLVAKTNGPPAGIVQQMTPSMSRDIFAVGQDIERDMRMMTAAGRNQQGEYDRSSRRTAREVDAVERAIALRGDERRDQVADLIASAFQRKIHPMIFRYWTTERVIEVTSRGQWATFTGPQIRGDYAVQAIADSVIPLTRELRRQTALQLFGALRQDPMVNPRTLREWLVQQFSDHAVPANLLLTPQEMQAMQQQQQQQRMAELIIRGRVHQPSPSSGRVPAGVATGGNGAAT